jgi:hypothetical protein
MCQVLGPDQNNSITLLIVILIIDVLIIYCFSVINNHIVVLTQWPARHHEGVLHKFTL